MAKITMDGMIIEGTIEELAEMGFNFPVEEEPDEPLKVGDYVKVIDGFGYHIGKIAEVVGVEGTMASLNVISPNKKSLAGSPVDCLVRATDEEVAEAKRKLTEAEKWAKIGREPNEIKVGDVVRRAPGYYDVVANIHGGNKLDKGERLVVPVEARFDV